MDSNDSVKFAKKYLEDILAFFDLNIDIDVYVEDEIIVANIPSSERSSLLIGRGADTLRSMQYLLSTTLRNQNATVSRVNLDIADYKKQQAERLAKKARQWIEEVRETGDSKVLDLGAADRWIVHNVASEYSDIITHSEGEGRDRRLIISQQS